MAYSIVRPTRVWRTLEYVLPEYTAYSIVRPTRVWRTLESMVTAVSMDSRVQKLPRVRAMQLLHRRCRSKKWLMNKDSDDGFHLLWMATGKQCHSDQTEQSFAPTAFQAKLSLYIFNYSRYRVWSVRYRSIISLYALSAGVVWST